MGILLTESYRSVDPFFPRQARREALVLCGCFLGALLLRLFRVDVPAGVLPDFISALPVIGHRGFVCPLCGGIRSFVLVAAFSFPEALHCSILGTCISSWLLLTLPIRLLCLFSARPLHEKLYFRVKKFENPDHLLVMMAFCMWLQLCLHYFGGFLWIPLLQLTQTS